jgi:hypothetical protein
MQRAWSRAASSQWIKMVRKRTNYDWLLIHETTEDGNYWPKLSHFFPNTSVCGTAGVKAQHAVSVGQPPQSLLRAFGAAVIGSVGLQSRPLRTHDWKHRAELIWLKGSGRVENGFSQSCWDSCFTYKYHMTGCAASAPVCLSVGKTQSPKALWNDVHYHIRPARTSHCSCS